MESLPKTHQATVHLYPWWPLTRCCTRSHAVVQEWCRTWAEGILLNDASSYTVHMGRDWTQCLRGPNDSKCVVFNQLHGKKISVSRPENPMCHTKNNCDTLLNTSKQLITYKWHHSRLLLCAHITENISVPAALKCKWIQHAYFLNLLEICSLIFLKSPWAN